MHRVHEPTQPREDLPVVPIPVDRHQLAKRRWRGEAEDGTAFGFDLETPLWHGATVRVAADRQYRIAQHSEPCLRIPLGTPEEAASIGWRIGNLHFQAAFGGGAVLVMDDLAVRQMLEREGIAHEPVEMVFQPAAQTGHDPGAPHSHGGHVHPH
jgi:urease accessory protein